MGSQKLFSLNSTISKGKASSMSPVVLAFIGDAVYTLYIREKYAFSCDFKSGELHRLSSKRVSATAQSRLLDKLLPILTEEEMDIYKRGRNAKKPTKAKSSTVADYNRSTGFESLVGYLYVTGNLCRLDYLLSLKEDEIDEN